MLSQMDSVLGDITPQPIDLSPRRFGLVKSCDGTMVEVSGLAVPVGSICSIAHGGAAHGDGGR